MEIRKAKFLTLPYVDNILIQAVKKKLIAKEFSKFLGSPDITTRKYLSSPSKQLINLVKSEKSFFGGKSILQLENNWSKICKCKYTISVNSATSGLTTAIMACDIGPGDEVLCSPFTFTASIAAIIAANAIPIFCDINEDNFCLDPNEIKKLINIKTKAILAIHWNSNVGDLTEIKKICKIYKLKLIEDASQCHGMKYKNKHIGTIGHVGVFSLNEPKNIMVGEGGLITTNNKDIAIKCRLIRNHGENIVNNTDSNKKISNIVGYNFRLSEILAEIGVHQVKKMNYLNNIRKKNYIFLIKKLKKYNKYLVPQKITNQTYYPYTVAFRFISSARYKRKNLINFFLKNKIPITSGISRLISEHPMFIKKIAYGQGHCPFSCHLYNKKYNISKLDKAKKLNDKEYIGFYQIGWPNNTKDMKDIVRGFDLFFKKN